MKEKFLRWYVCAFRLFVPITSFLWTCQAVIGLDLLSHKWEGIFICLVFVCYLGSYLLIKSGRTNKGGDAPKYDRTKE